MDQDPLKALLKEAMAEMVEEKRQALVELDRWAFFARTRRPYQRPLPAQVGDRLRCGRG